MSRLVIASLAFILIPVSLGSQQPAGTATPIPVFADSARRTKLAEAFTAIRDSMPAAAKQIGAPGLAWGVIIDGELAASGAVGIRDVKAEAAAAESTVFRIASMSKSFTALAILKLRDAGKLSLDDAVTKHIPEFAAGGAADRRCAGDHDPPPADALRGLSRRQPMGRSAAGRPRADPEPLAHARAALLDLSRHCLRILELRLRAAWPHRHERVGPTLRRLHPATRS